MSSAMLDLKAELKRELAEVKGSVAPPSGFRVSLKGKMFTFPDGTQSAGPIDCVILDWRTAHTYYKGVYNPQKPESPACFALGKVIETLKPSENVPEPQADSCGKCPMNQFGSAATGRGKACKNSRLLAVVPADADENTEPWIVTVSPTGIKGFDNYVTKLSGVMGMVPIQVTTRMALNPNEAYPTLVFGSPEPHEMDLALLFKLREAAQPLLDKEPEMNRT